MSTQDLQESFLQFVDRVTKKRPHISLGSFKHLVKGAFPDVIFDKSTRDASANKAWCFGIGLKPEKQVDFNIGAGGNVVPIDAAKKA